MFKLNFRQALGTSLVSRNLGEDRTHPRSLLGDCEGMNDRVLHSELKLHSKSYEASLPFVIEFYFDMNYWRTRTKPKQPGIRALSEHSFLLFKRDLLFTRRLNRTSPKGRLLGCRLSSACRVPSSSRSPQEERFQPGWPFRKTSPGFLQILPGRTQARMAWTSMTQQLAAQLRPGGPPWAGVKEHSSHLECVSRIVACGKHEAWAVLLVCTSTSYLTPRVPEHQSSISQQKQQPPASESDRFSGSANATPR